MAMAAAARAMVVMAVKGACKGLQAEAEEAGAAVARASLCSTRSRCIPSRRSHRRLRPRLGRACSRHLERHKTLGKGRHARTHSSSGGLRSATKPEAGEVAVTVGVAGEVAVTVGVAQEVAAMVGGEKAARAREQER